MARLLLLVSLIFSTLAFVALAAEEFQIQGAKISTLCAQLPHIQSRCNEGSTKWFGLERSHRVTGVLPQDTQN